MSPRAAWRLERLGYGPVHDYVGGKVDWLAAGLPSEGEGSREASPRSRPTSSPLRRPLALASVAAAGAGLYLGVATGRVTVDLGLGRRRRSLGPLEIGFRAPADVVFDVIAGPYLHATPRAM